MKDLDFIDDILEDDIEGLRARIAKAKNQVLMEEPCPFYEIEDWTYD